MTLEEAKEVKAKLDLAIRQAVVYAQQLRKGSYTVTIEMPEDIYVECKKLGINVPAGSSVYKVERTTL